MSPFTLCYENIAAEEYLLNNMNEDIFLLYINEPCIIVGKNQNTYSEINQNYVRQHHLPVVRRMSGGGAVYHDLGNLNFCFIADNKGKEIDAVFREYTNPVLDVLHNLGVPAEFTGRNDLSVNGKKISGNAQYYTSSKVLHHGTMLFDSDIQSIAASLNVSEEKFIDKAVKSVRSRVGNISDYLDSPLSIQELSKLITNHVMSSFSDCEIYSLSQEDMNSIKKLVERKYATHEWNYNAFSEFTFKNTLKCSGGNVELRLNLNKGIINNVNIYGDFFGKKDIKELESLLINKPYDFTVIEKTLSSVDMDDYISGLSLSQFLQNIFDFN
jgi:lipoate-protein ligase A